jgi:hypothetical protein
VSAPVILRLPPGHVHSYGFLLAHLTGPVTCGKAVAFLLLALPGTGGVAKPSRLAPEGLSTARFSEPVELKKRPTREWALVQPHPPKPPPRPTSGSHCLLCIHALDQAGEQYIWAIYRPICACYRCPFSPPARPYSPGGAAHRSHTGQFSFFGPRSCFIEHP